MIPQEKKIFEGVYMTDYRQNKLLSMEVAKKEIGDLSDTDLEELKLAIAYKEHIIINLIRSNKEMEEYDPEKKDDEVQKAIDENKIWIVKHHDILNDCKKRLEAALTMRKILEKNVKVKAQKKPATVKYVEKEKAQEKPKQIQKTEKKIEMPMSMEDDDDNGMYL